MKKIFQPIVFFGTESFSAASLQALLDATMPVRLVITKPDSRRGRGQKVEQPEVKKIATAHHIPCLQPEQLSEIIPAISNLKTPVGVLVSYGKIIPKSIIDLFSPGIINVHPSLLPLYRGPSPIESAILNGDTEAGISIMKLTAKMDAGPIYQQEKIALNGTEKKPELYQTLQNIGAQYLVESLAEIISGRLQAQPQDESQASYCQLLSKQAAMVDPLKVTADYILRHIRAYFGFPRTKMILHSQACIILAAHCQPKVPIQKLFVQTKDRNYVIIDKLIAANGKTMSGEEFLHGYT